MKYVKVPLAAALVFAGTLQAMEKKEFTEKPLSKVDPKQLFLFQQHRMSNLNVEQGSIKNTNDEKREIYDEETFEFMQWQMRTQRAQKYDTQKLEISGLSLNPFKAIYSYYSYFIGGESSQKSTSIDWYSFE